MCTITSSIKRICKVHLFLGRFSWKVGIEESEMAAIETLDVCSFSVFVLKIFIMYLDEKYVYDL